MGIDHKQQSCLTHTSMDTISILSSLPIEQRWRMQKSPASVVVALIRQTTPRRGEEFLLIKRVKGPYTGLWALVGGLWDFGETMAEAIVREAWEETGLTTSFVALRGVVSERVAPWQPGDMAAHFLLLVCDLVVKDGQAAEQQEGQVAWFDRPAIDALQTAAAIIPSDYAMIHEFADATQHAPYVDVEMRALVENATAQTSEMLRFQRHDQP